MKLLALFSLLLFSSLGLASNISINDLIGNYSVISKDQIAVFGKGVKIQYEFNVSQNETIRLVEKVVQTLEGKDTELMRMECAGPVVIDHSQVLISRVVCTNGEEFIQRIKLSNIPNIFQSEFVAPVFSSLYGMEVEMIFRRK